MYTNFFYLRPPSQEQRGLKHKAACADTDRQIL
jgi:hypothetical protein